MIIEHFFILSLAHFCFSFQLPLMYQLHCKKALQKMLSLTLHYCHSQSQCMAREKSFENFIADHYARWRHKVFHPLVATTFNFISNSFSLHQNLTNIDYFVFRSSLNAETTVELNNALLTSDFHSQALIFFSITN